MAGTPRKRSRFVECRPVRLASAGVLVSSGLLGSYVGGYRSPRAWAAGSFECSSLVGDISTDDSLNAAIAEINLGNCNTLDISSDITLDGNLTPINTSNLGEPYVSVNIEGKYGPVVLSGANFSGFSVTGPPLGISGVIVENVSFTGFTRTSAGIGGAALAVDLNVGYGGALGLLLRNVAFSGNSTDDSGGAVSLTSQSGIDITVDDSAIFDGNTSSAGDGGALYLNGPIVRFQVGFGQATYLGFANNTSAVGDGGAIASTGEIILDSATFTGNTAGLGSGGAIAADGEVDISSSTFTNNQALEGGAIHTPDYLVSEDNVFTTNMALAGKGGVLHGSEVYSDTDVFMSNSSDDSSGTAVSGGGAIYGLTKVDSQDSVFVGNDADGGSGGAVLSPRATSTDDSFSLNTADDSGGAVSTTAGTLTITRGEFAQNQASVGGAAYQTGGVFDLENSLFTMNTAEAGGALYHRATRLEMDNTRFMGNSATGSGGAIYSNVINEQAVIYTSTFRGNSADDTGGAIYFTSAANDLLNLYRTWFDDNYAAESGAVHSRGRLQIQSVLFSGNDASVRAGAVGDDSGVILMEAATFLTNGDDTAPSVGGGLVSSPNGYVYMVNVTAVGNSADDTGGFAYLRGGTGAKPNAVDFSTITGNSLTSGVGAGVASPASAVTAVSNSIVQGNLDGADPDDLFLPAVGSSLGSSFVTSVNSVDPAALGSGSGVQFGSNPGLADLANNGGLLVGAGTDDTFMPTRMPLAESPLIGGATAVSATDQAAADAVGTPRSTTGPNAIGAVQVASPTPPVPPTPIPASSPRNVSVTAGDREVTVTWQAPVSSGSFPVSQYQMQASPGGASCLVAAPELTCVITGLMNGVEYTVRGRALTGAGWSVFSAASDPVTPSVQQSIVITGAREGREVRVDGVTNGLVGSQVTPWVRFPGPNRYAPGSGVRTVDAQGEFTWQRRTGKKIYVYFRASDDVRSNRVIIPAR